MITTWHVGNEEGSTLVSVEWGQTCVTGVEIRAICLLLYLSYSAPNVERLATWGRIPRRKRQWRQELTNRKQRLGLCHQSSGSNEGP
jgi:hypothetical protein